MKINRLFYPLILLMAILSLGSTQAEEEKSVGSVDNGLNAIDSCQANYATEGQLNIPCVNVSGVSYAVKLQPIAPDNTQFTLTSVTPNPVVVNSACVATYSLETGQLDVPCVVRENRSATGGTGNLVLYADDPSNPSLFGFEQFLSERRAKRTNNLFGDPISGGQYKECLYGSLECAVKGEYHTGIDYNSGSSDDVVSTGDGVVEEVVGMGEQNHQMGKTVIIKHKLTDGNIIYSLYAHLDSIDSSIQPGSLVSKGQLIGIRGGSGKHSLTFWGKHLHFEMKTAAVLGAPNGDEFWGYVQEHPDDYGYSDPNYYIGNIEFSPNPPPTYFDGAGSLISPKQRNEEIRGGYGAYKDTARMQPHADNGRLSTVVFQFKKDSSCDHIDITSDDIKEVIIQVKGWSHDKMAKAFTGKLPMSVPNLGTYTVVAVTSTQPLDSKADVNAECKTSGDAKKGSGTDLDMNIWGDVTLDNGYFWTGTGSIISALYPGTSKDPHPDAPGTKVPKDFGKNVDEVPTPDSHKSLSSFQWYPSDGCKNLRIAPTTTSTGIQFSGDEGIELKSWASSSWVKVEREKCKGLPCTISATSGDYYVIKVKIDKQHAEELGNLQAGCKQ